MSNTSTLVMHDPGTLIACVPHLMGFKPHEDLVAVWLKQGQILVTQRVDIGTTRGKEAELCAAPIREGADKVVFITFSEKEWRKDVVALGDYIVDVGLDWLDLLWVKGNKYGSYACACTNPNECPSNGTVDDSLAAFLVGLTPAPEESREDIAALFKGKVNAELAAEAEATVKEWMSEDIEYGRDLCIDHIIRVFANYDDLDLAVAAYAMLDVRVRDAILRLMVDLEHDDLLRAFDISALAARLVPDEDAKAVLTTAAVCAWMCGDGARANVAVDLALTADPDYSLALLVRHSLTAGMPPSMWKEAMQALTYEDARVPRHA